MNSEFYNNIHILEKMVISLNENVSKHPRYVSSFFRDAYFDLIARNFDKNSDYTTWIMNQIILIYLFHFTCIHNPDYYLERLHSFIPWRAVKRNSKRGPPNKD